MSVSPAERPAAPRARLSRERVLTAALALLDEKGLDQLTMRRLAHQLGRDPMALYRYLPNRAALLDGVVELFLAQLSAPIQDLDWQAQLRSSAHDFRRLALSHPHVVPLLVTRPLSHPLGLQPLGVLRPVEQMLTRLIGAGFAPVTALHVHRAYTGCLYGHILTELQELIADPEETDDLLRLGLQRLPAREFPVLRSLASALAGYDGGAELDRSLDTLLAGLDAQLATQSGTVGS